MAAVSVKDIAIKRDISRRRSARPFLKWAGGKGQLLEEIGAYYPFAKDQTITKYAEPFVGGGAVLFDVLNKFSLDEVYISDINKDLIDTYLAIRDNVDELIGRLRSIEKTYLELDETGRKNMYMRVRGRFNELKHLDKTEFNPEKSTIMIL